MELPVDWSLRFPYYRMSDFGDNDFGSASDPVLSLLKKDMSATSVDASFTTLQQWFLPTCSQ
jgi:hypothetical protein